MTTLNPRKAWELANLKDKAWLATVFNDPRFESAVTAAFAEYSRRTSGLEDGAPRLLGAANFMDEFIAFAAPVPDQIPQEGGGLARTESDAGFVAWKDKRKPNEKPN